MGTQLGSQKKPVSQDTANLPKAIENPTAVVPAAESCGLQDLPASVTQEQRSLDTSYPCGLNATHVQKAPYSTQVSDQMPNMHMHLMDYYARQHEIQGGMPASVSGVAANSLATFTTLAGLHKAGEARFMKALKQDGANWQDSDALTKMDKEYIKVAHKRIEQLSETRLAELGKLGLSFEAAEENPEQVVQKVLKHFGEKPGQLGYETVKASQAMPIYCDVVTRKADLQCGDRLIERPEQGGAVVALRGGDLSAQAKTAITSLAIVSTCQGPGISMKRIMEVAKTSGNEAFKRSSDENYVRNQYRNSAFIKKNGLENLSDEQRMAKAEERIQALDKKGMIARGVTMFTEGRWESTPNYLVLCEQLDCLVGVASSHETLTAGKADGPLVIAGKLGIMHGDSQNLPEASAAKDMSISLTKNGEVALNAVVTTDEQGQFGTAFPKEALNQLPSGDYEITARFVGDVRNESLDCEASAPLSIKPEPAVLKQPEAVERQVYATLYSPQKDGSTWSKTSSGSVNLSEGAPIPDDILDPETGKFPGAGKALCHDELEWKKTHRQVVSEKEQWAEAGMKNAYKGLDVKASYGEKSVATEQTVDLTTARKDWDNRNNPPVVEHQRLYTNRTTDTQSSFGLSVGKTLKMPVTDNLDLSLSGRGGYAVGSLKNGPTYGLGAEANAGIAKDLRANLIADFSNDIQQAMLKISGGVEYKDFGLGVTKGKDMTGVRLSYKFR